MSLESPLGHNQLVRDRGYRAWLQVVGSFMVFFSTAGMANMFGVYMTFYLDEKKFDASVSAISWIGSLQAALCLALGIFTGPLYDRGYFYHLMYTGSFLVVLGQMMLSLSSSYYQAFLSQGVCMGLGAGLALLPSFCIIVTYFDRHLEVATGIAYMGGGVGGIILPIIFSQTVYKIGFAWATRVVGLVLFVPLLIAASVFRPLKKSERPRPFREFISWNMFKEPSTVVFLLGVIVAIMSVNIPAYYMQEYASAINIKDKVLISYILPIYLAAYTCGCFGLNALAKWVGPFNVISVSVGLSGALTWALVDLNNKGGLVVVVVFLGFLSAAPSSLQPACYVKLCPDIQQMGSRIGCGYMASTIGSLVGAPIAGAILDRYGYNPVWIFSASMSLIGAAIFMISRGFHTGWRVWIKV
ncbi:major facilitator superfamily domain-containing protein [Penicillium lividum]|nr:major facilitator superfamily domain-containing protein [Penicillium lividum]